MSLSFGRRTRLLLSAMAVTLAAPSANAGVGDLLVAPTRLILNGGRGGEIILKNVGDQPATYRVSAELRRMTPSGTLEEVAAPTDEEKTAQNMIMFAPRKIILPPGQPQSVRITARAPAGLADGEYRVHLMFRAVPEPTAVGSTAPVDGIAFKLTPIYGVTIPVIVRYGNLEATAGISNVALGDRQGQKALLLDLTRTGNRSTYGEIQVIGVNAKDPIARLKGVAIYKEIATRHLALPLDAAALAAAKAGPVKVRYFETSDAGASLIAETSAVLR